MLIGHGFDAHRFGPGDHVVLGGVRVPHSSGIVAHSDGDVLIHALCDALLGAAGLGDIGRHFPDSDEQYRGMDSRRMLRQVVGLLRENGLRTVNADITLIAEKPRIAKFADEMRKYLAQDIELEVQRVNVKATTTEGMGHIGRGEGLAAHAVVLLEQRSQK